MEQVWKGQNIAGQGRSKVEENIGKYAESFEKIRKLHEHI